MSQLTSTQLPHLTLLPSLFIYQPRSPDPTPPTPMALQALPPSLGAARWSRTTTAAAATVGVGPRRMNLSSSYSSSSSSSSSERVEEFDGGGRGVGGRRAVVVDIDLDHGVRFDSGDFDVCDRVSVGLAGKADEMIFQAVVTNPNSPLYSTKLVLRQLTTMQAQRRGRRALQVLKRLARRQLMYHSYAMQVHGYIYLPKNGGEAGSFTLVHGYHDSYSLRHWLQLSDWLPTLEATLDFDEEWVRRVGDDSVGGPAVTRQLRLTRILMRDLLIGVNYLHSHGLAHTELRLENVHISPVDRHVKVGILGNAADFHDSNLDNTKDVNHERQQLMIAYDMRCVGLMMAQMVLQELMDPQVFLRFKSFLAKRSDPSCLREFLIPMLSKNSPSGNAGLQMLDRNWGSGWNLLSMLLATKPSKRIRCLDALRHPFLCGPRWRMMGPSVDIIRWSLGSTMVRIAEEYIYGKYQKDRMAYFIELMEVLNLNPKQKDWLELLPGKWRLLYSTGRHIGLTLRQAQPRVLIDNAYLTITETSESDRSSFEFTSDVSFKVISTLQWPHDKSGDPGSLNVSSQSTRLTSGQTVYVQGESKQFSRESVARKLSSRKWKTIGSIKELPTNLPAVKINTDDIEITMNLETSSNQLLAQRILREVRMQIPPEMFDISKLVCGTYVDSRLMILRGVDGSALLFTRSC